MARSRTLGWPQDAGKLSRARIALEDIASGNESDASYTASRTSVSYSLGIKRWANDSYIRMLHALGFIEWDREDDDFAVTERGARLLSTNIGSEGELVIFQESLLSYPPVCRIMDLLQEVYPKPLSKFELGQQLGFRGERGFPSLTEESFVVSYANAATKKDKRKVISNHESTADKYARMFAGWLKEVDWVEQKGKIGTYQQMTAPIGQSYSLTAEGRRNWRRIRGTSTQERVTKNVWYEMLASGKQKGYPTLRHRRALTIELLDRHRSKGLPLSTIADYLTRKGFVVTPDEVVQDIEGLVRIGIDVERVGGRYYFNDRVALDMPRPEQLDIHNKAKIKAILEELEQVIHHVPAEYFQAIEQSYTKAEALNFEQTIHDLFVKVMGYAGKKLGGPNVPDSLVWYKAVSGDTSYGMIMDTKTRGDGFNIPIGSRDQMRRYIEEFIPIMANEHGVDHCYFLWASSCFGGAFAFNMQKLRDLTNTSGAVISARNCLYLAERVKVRARPEVLLEIEPLFACLDEITAPRIESYLS